MPEETRGRPSVYSKALAALICAELAKGRTLRDVCRDDGMPDESTVREWALDNRKENPQDDEELGFSPQYSRAREIGYHSVFDETLEIADDGTNDWVERSGEDGQRLYVLNGEHVQRSRLRVDTRKWFLAKALPKLYGEKITTEHSGPGGGPIQTEETGGTELARRIAFALTSAVGGKGE
jgi:hypothetical protein